MNATGGGCHYEEGDGAGKEIDCCHNAGGSYGGFGTGKFHN